MAKTADHREGMNADGNSRMPIYIDNNATTSMAPEVRSAVVEALDVWGNPSSDNALGLLAKRKIDEARSSLASLFGVEPRRVVFTSGGSESNNLIVLSLLNSFHSERLARGVLEPGRMMALSSTIEHPSVLGLLRALEAQGRIDLRLLAVDPASGRFNLPDLRNCEPSSPNDFLLVTLMLANGETGAIQPVGDVIYWLRGESPWQGRCHIHVDACQAVGKMHVHLTELGADSLSLSGHKFYGPRNGALILGSQRANDILQRFPLVYGGGQEMGIRSGTENTPLIAGLGAAAMLISEHLKKYESHMRRIRDHFEQRLREEIGVAINYDSSPRLCNMSSVCFLDIPCSSKELLKACSDVFVASGGSACHAKSAG